MLINNRILLSESFSLRTALVIMVLCLIVSLSGCESEKKGDIAPVATQSRASSADLYCEEFISYSGPFVEDGTNDNVENVLALLLENRSDEYLEFATITYDVDGETAKFVASGLPAGAKAWVLETNRMEAKADSQFEFLECESTFRDDAVLTTDKLEVSYKDNELIVKNITDDVLKNPCVYYKNINSDGYYLGGITYMIGFDTLKPDATAKKQAGHYTENSAIVRYSYQTD